MTHKQATELVKIVDGVPAY